MSERGRETARDRGSEGGWDNNKQYVEKNTRGVVHLEGKVRNNVGKLWKGRAAPSPPQSVLTGAEQRVGDGLAVGGSFIPSSFFLSLLLHTPPSPAPPLGTCLLPKFLFLCYSIHSVLFFFFVICLFTLPSLPFFTFD